MNTLLQAQTLENYLVLAGRVLIFVTYLALVVFFQKTHARSKKDGVPNKFALGYAMFFGFLTGYGVMSVVNEMLVLFAPGGGFIGQLDTRFEILYNLTPDHRLILPNLANPLYLIGLAILMVLLAAQVYPLEYVLGWRYRPGTVYLFVIAVALVPVFIPALSYSLYTDIVTLGTVLGILIGLVLNIGINIKLAASSTGDLRKRSFSIIFASILFYVGFMMSLKIAEISLLYRLVGTPLGYDIFLGCVVQAISAMLYWRGLRAG